ncbi:MAG TPA: S41 family peptidase [Clostridia bacterium]|nr:S41 family peptidase [Clostridia bacterium]
MYSIIKGTIGHAVFGKNKFSKNVMVFAFSTSYYKLLENRITQDCGGYYEVSTMKKMSFDQFKEYYSARYVNYYRFSAFAGMQNIVDYVLANGDLWFYIASGDLFTLHNLGFEVLRCEDGYIFYRVNENVTDQIGLGDCLISINGHSPDEPFERTGTDKGAINLIIKTPLGHIKNITMKPPKTEDNCRIETLYESLSEDLGYIKIRSFSINDTDTLKTLLSQKTRVIIDLSDCSGGPVNEMLQYASYFADQNMRLSFEDKNGIVTNKVLPAQSENDIAVKQIDFVVSTKTASSAEMFCLLLRTYYAGIIYGKKTTGNLFVQEFIDVAGVIVALPVYRLIKPYRFYGGMLANYDGESILPDCDDSLISCSAGVSGSMSGF